MASCRYWHRSLNPKKLIEVKFSHLGKNMTMQRTLKLYKLPTETTTSGFRRLKMEDVDQCHKLLGDYLQKFDLAPVFSKEEFVHWFLPQEKIIDSYVVENYGNVSGKYFSQIYICSNRILTFGIRSIHSPAKVGLVIIKLLTTSPVVSWRGWEPPPPPPPPSITA